MSMVNKEIKRLHAIIRERDDEIARLRFELQWQRESEERARKLEQSGFWRE